MSLLIFIQYVNVLNLLQLSAANGIIKSKAVEEVMLKVDRGKYAKFNPYMDAPQGIGYGVTISAPHMVRYQFINVIVLEIKPLKIIFVEGLK